MNFVKNNMVFVGFFVVACGSQIQASISIDSDTIAKFYTSGLSFSAIESMDRVVTPFVNKDATVREKGFAKLLVGGAMVIGAAQLYQKNKVKSLVECTGEVLLVSGCYDALVQPEEFSFAENTAIFGVNAVAKQVAVDIFKKNTCYSQLESRIIVDLVSTTAAAIVNSEEGRSKGSVARISRGVRNHGIASLGVETFDYINRKCLK